MENSLLHFQDLVIPFYVPDSTRQVAFNSICYISIIYFFPLFQKMSVTYIHVATPVKNENGKFVVP